MSYVIEIEDLKRSRFTQSLILINIICFIIANMIIGPYSLIYVGQYNIAISEGNEYWRLFTAMFFHVNLEHIFMNMLALLVIGSSSEKNLPSIFHYIIIYIGSGVVGNMFTLWIEGPYNFSLGASGAIAGLQGALLMIIGFRDKNMQLLTIIFIFLFLIQSFSPGIGTWAHIFGLLSGIAAEK